MGGVILENIIIVECRSTGMNFIEDIVNRGHNPVVLETKPDDSDVAKNYTETMREHYKHIPYDFDIIYEEEEYEKTLEEVKKYNPLLVLPGNEKGVILASRLASDLGLKCNPIENLDSMTLKHEMQKRLAEYGIRSIRGKVIRSVEEAVEFYEKEQLGEVVVKPIYSSGSANVRIFSNKEDMAKSLEKQFTKTNEYGQLTDVLLIQERIVGDEYIVNTVACDGHHRVTLVWKYNKVRTTDGAIIYDTCETVNELNLGEAEMIEYAYDVADALGIKWGPVHGEYMLDEKGPVLIEVNCRPCGGHMPAKFLDRISGQHETDSILDAYLKPERFQEQLKRKYELYAHGALKFFIVPDEVVAKSTPVKNISFKLKSHFDTEMDNLDEEDKKTYFKTEDVASACGIVYLVNEDGYELQSNIDYLRSVEKHAFSLILNKEEVKEDPGEEAFYLENFEKLIQGIDKYGVGLLVTDQFVDDDEILQIGPEQLNEVGGDFDFLLVNLNKSITENKSVTLINILLESFSKLKPGGYVFIPKATYQLFDGGRRAMEALIKVLDLKIELPPYGVKDLIVASKK